MSESFLHYLWQFQYFDKNDLRTASGEPVQVFYPGIRNTHAGPDFSNARIKIGDMEWVGSVEVHIHSSGWMEHKHHTDSAYENVVLHVVWKNDKPVERNDGTLLPAIELQDRVDDQMLLKYKRLVSSPQAVACSGTFREVSDVVKLSMLDKATSQRLELKAMQILEMQAMNNNDWEETSYQLISRNFGFKVNGEPFSQLAKALPYKFLLKHSDKLIQLESLLFGQAGFLEDTWADEYYNLLQREYQLLGRKYSLMEQRMNKAQWRFLRLRPSNFPTVRLAQLASLICKQRSVFSRILEAETYKQLKDLFSVQQSVYWQKHYRFFKSAKEAVPSLGESSIENIVINSVVPLLVAYGRSRDEQQFVDRAVNILQQIPGEVNTVTKQWMLLNLPAKTAFDSQGLIELFNNFCQKRRCLECAIGSVLVKPQNK